MTQSFPMNGGNGTDSYAKNSQYQKEGADFAKGLMINAIVDKLDNISTTFSIADLGCAAGPNTFFTVQTLIESVEKKCALLGVDYNNIDFQVFFNDHTDNDFNTLFASIPPDHKQLYYATGAPGSFHGRLFSRSSINLVHSSYALHWLSKVPEELTDSKSTAWNEGKIHYMGSSPQVMKAYAEQFEKDVGVFLSARADEIVPGGLMLLLMSGVPDGSIGSFQGVLSSFVGSILMEMATEGTIDKAEIDSFNLPIYAPTVVEMTKVIEQNGYFSIEKIELIQYSRSQNNEAALSVDAMITIMRGLSGIFRKHFGDVAVDKMFDKMVAKSEEMSHFFESSCFCRAQLFIVLKRK